MMGPWGEMACGYKEDLLHRTGPFFPCRNHWLEESPEPRLCNSFFCVQGRCWTVFPIRHSWPPCIACKTYHCDHCGLVDLLNAHMLICYCNQKRMIVESSL